MEKPDKKDNMLSYQHGYHAGNLADVHKHSVLSMVLSAMNEKDKPLSYFETHAGRGLYDLTSAEAEKTAEATCGILDFLHNPKKKQLLPLPYLYAIDKVHTLLGKNFYAGSPLLARILSDRQDNSFNLMELHPQEYAALHKIMYDFKNVHVHKRDGYEGVSALCPPRPPLPARGFVLIDPSYEEKDEYAQAADFVLKLHKKWETAVIMIWYPILSANMHTEITEKITSANLPKTVSSEVMFKTQPKSEGMLGSGIIIVNTPFACTEDIKTFTSAF